MRNSIQQHRLLAIARVPWQEPRHPEVVCTAEVGAEEGEDLCCSHASGVGQLSCCPVGIRRSGMTWASSARGGVKCCRVTRESARVNFYVRFLQRFIMIFNSIKCWHALKIGESSAI